MKAFRITTTVLLTVQGALAQVTTNDLYQYNYTTVSPAFAGVDGQKISFIGSVYMPGTGRYYGLGFMGYETAIKKINSGVGFNATFEQQGARTFSDLNFIYNYQWAIDDQSKLVFGVRLTGSQFALDYSMVNQGAPSFDPDIQVGNYSANTVTTGAAILYKRNNLFAALTADNLIQKTTKLYGLAVFRGFYDPVYKLVVGGDFKMGKRISTTHSLYVVKNDNLWRFDINNTMLLNNWFIGGLSLEINNSDHDNQFLPKVNGGVSIKNKARFIFSLYSETYNISSKKFSGQMLMDFRI